VRGLPAILRERRDRVLRGFRVLVESLTLVLNPLTLLWRRVCVHLSRRERSHVNSGEASPCGRGALESARLARG
jgi:hypothetical protein